MIENIIFHVVISKVLKHNSVSRKETKSAFDGPYFLNKLENSKMATYTLHGFMWTVSYFTLNKIPVIEFKK